MSCRTVRDVETKSASLSLLIVAPGSTQIGSDGKQRPSREPGELMTIERSNYN